MLYKFVVEDIPDRANINLPVPPPLPSDSISVIRDMAEALQVDEVRPLSILVADIQVQASRLSESINRAGNHEHLLVIETRDGARCPGLQTIIVGVRTGRLYEGVCQASISVNAGTQRAYYEAELDRLLGIFHPLLAPHAPRRGEPS